LRGAWRGYQKGGAKCAISEAWNHEWLGGEFKFLRKRGLGGEENRLDWLGKGGCGGLRERTLTTDTPMWRKIGGEGSV